MEECLMESVNGEIFALAERLKKRVEDGEGMLDPAFLNDICRAEHILRCVAAAEEPGVSSESAMEAILQSRMVALTWKGARASGHPA